MKSHSAAVQAVASGIHALPEVSQAFSTTQAAYRFFNNPRVSLADLAAPLVEFARDTAKDACDDYLLVVHDWSQLMYPQHTAKEERVSLSSRTGPDGYEIQTALAVSDRDGVPIAPVEISLRAGDGVHESRSPDVREPLSPLDELGPTMQHVEQLALPRPLVHIVDAEADSVAHYRDWDAAGHQFLVRADDRLVAHNQREQKCATIQKELRSRGLLQETRNVKYHGRPARQFVGEADVVLTRPAQRNRPEAGDRRRIPGRPLPLRLVISEVRDFNGKLLATWFLLTNVPDQVPADTIALWYYWRWSIEKFFKLLKSGGQQLEQWQQQSAGAIARRLWVASMACTTVWQLARNEHPDAEAARQLLVRLSGRQMKRGVTYTIPAMLAGLWTLLAMLDVLEHYSLEDLKRLANLALPP